MMKKIQGKNRSKVKFNSTKVKRTIISFSIIFLLTSIFFFIILVILAYFFRGVYVELLIDIIQHIDIQWYVANAQIEVIAEDLRELIKDYILINEELKKEFKGLKWIAERIIENLIKHHEFPVIVGYSAAYLKLLSVLWVAYSFKVLILFIFYTIIRLFVPIWIILSVFIFLIF